MHKPAIPVTPEEDSIDLAGLARTLWFGKGWILGMICLCALIGGLYATVLTTPSYRATAVVMLESREASILGLDSVLGELSTGTSSVVRTEIEVLRGRMLIGRVVDDLDLTADPEFNAALKPPGRLARIMAPIMAPIMDWIRPPAPDLRSPADRQDAARVAAVTALLGNVAVLNTAGSLVFQITVTSEDPAKAARIADAIARLYIEDQRRVRFEATEAAAIWLTDQLADLRGALEKAVTEVRHFQSETNLIDAETLAAMDRQLKETRNRRDQARAQAADLSERIDRIGLTADPVEQARIAGDDALIALAAGAVDGAGFDHQMQLVLTRLMQDRARLEGQVRSLGTAAATLSAEIERQSQELIRLEQLEREAESSRLLYEHFQTRLKETSAQLGIQQADSRVLSDAVVPDRPASPRSKLVLAVGMVLGLVLGVLIVLLRDMQSRSLRTARALEELTGLTVLAQLPEIPGRTPEAGLAWLAEHPTSAPAEAIRNLRTSILLSAAEKEPQVIVLTSSLPGEGKTTTTAALAQNLVAMGRRVLVIEGDIRKQSLSRRLAGAVPGGAGLIAAMRGTVPLADCLRKTVAQGDVLPCEAAPIGAVDLFAAPAFGQLIAAARQHYELILIDTPPVLAVPDARMIARHADATVFIVRWNQTGRDQVTEALHQLQMVNVQVTGLVLGHISAAGMRRYGLGYGSDGYGQAAYGNLR